MALRTSFLLLLFVIPTAVTFTAALPGGVLLAHPVHDPVHHGTVGGACRCTTAVLEDEWCDACAVGYVAAVTVPSEALFDVIDAHGHEMDLSSSTCSDCRSAAASDGYCERHKLGYVSGRGYVTVLGYSLAQGRRVGAADLSCDTCRAHVGRVGWCDQCVRGIVGNKAILDREAFERAQAGYLRLLDAVSLVNTCEYCAAALFGDSRCPRCKVTYRDGHPVSSRPTEEASP